MVEINRRKLITGLISFAAAPAIVKIENIMPVKVYDPVMTLDEYTNKILAPMLEKYQLNIGYSWLKLSIEETGKFLVENIEDIYIDYSTAISR